MEAYRAFYHEHKSKLFRYLMRMSGDYFLSSDIVQESFTRYLERYGEQTTSLALLFTIARHALFDHYRKQKSNLQLEGGQPACDGNQEYDLMIREDYHRVLGAMQKLKQDERDILSLAISDGLSYREIASIVGISLQNVKVKVHRSRLKLRSALNSGDEQ